MLSDCRPCVVDGYGQVMNGSPAVIKKERAKEIEGKEEKRRKKEEKRKEKKRNRRKETEKEKKK
jgi:hypothetical protein